MAILLHEDTRVAVQGITGREGSFHAGRNIDYGTKIVAGVTPGKGGEEALDDRVPVYDSLAEAVDEEGVEASMVFVPPRFAADAILEAEEAGCRLIVCITEGIPASEMAEVSAHLRGSEAVLIGPNCPGLISPGKANLGIVPTEICIPGRVGLVSRSGTLTYQIVNELTTRDIGQSTCLGIGGDPIIGTTFVEALTRFEADPETEAVVMIGEIGGDAEERAAEFIEAEMSKPVVAYIAGFTAPPGKRMGHAGAIVTGSSGTASAKAEALEARGVRVGRTPTQVAELVQDAL